MVHRSTTRMVLALFQANFQLYYAFSFVPSQWTLTSTKFLETTLKFKPISWQAHLSRLKTCHKSFMWMKLLSHMIKLFLLSPHKYLANQQNWSCDIKINANETLHGTPIEIGLIIPNKDITKEHLVYMVYSIKLIECCECVIASLHYLVIWIHQIIGTAL